MTQDEFKKLASGELAEMQDDTRIAKPYSGLDKKMGAKKLSEQNSLANIFNKIRENKAPTPSTIINVPQVLMEDNIDIPAGHDAKSIAWKPKEELKEMIKTGPVTLTVEVKAEDIHDELSPTNEINEWYGTKSNIDIDKIENPKKKKAVNELLQAAKELREDVEINEIVYYSLEEVSKYLNEIQENCNNYHKHEDYLLADKIAGVIAEALLQGKNKIKSSEL